MAKEPELPSDAAERQALVEIAQSMSVALMQSMQGADPAMLTAALVQGIVTQNDYADVLDGLVDPKLQKSHPYWGFKIVRPDGKVLGVVTSPKVLKPGEPDYTSKLSQWLLVYAYVTTPQLRVAWGAVRARVDFFQSEHSGEEPSSTPPPSPLRLVKP